MIKKLIGIIAVIAVSVIIYNTANTQLFNRHKVSMSDLYEMMPSSIKSESSDNIVKLLDNEVGPVLYEIIDKYGLDLRECSFKSPSKNKTVITIRSKTGYNCTVTLNTKTLTATVKVTDSSGKVVYHK